MESVASGEGSRPFSRLIEADTFLFSSSLSPTSPAASAALIEHLRSQTLGVDTFFSSPFGERKLTYCDYTASGRVVEGIENFLRDVVLPTYANTHTAASVTGHQTSLFRHEARMLIKRMVNANFSHGNSKDVLFFRGSGVTAGINSVIRMLGLNSIDADCVVFVSKFEHHSNLLPWKEAAGCEVIFVKQKQNSCAEIDLEDLEKHLSSQQHRKMRIGAFSAASNVTGQIANFGEICILLHRFGALSFWDFATAGPYISIDMNSNAISNLNYMDCIFLSPHKYLGGPGTPGIVVMKKKLIRNSKIQIPETVGGGNVFFVSEQNTKYLKKIEERIESGTPEIIGSIRAALALKLKDAIGAEFIEKKEAHFREIALKWIAKNPAIILLAPDSESVSGNDSSGSSGRCLPILSFVIATHQGGKLLHFNFVCALLNDLFGIQTRGGCMCAGPAAQFLLGISPKLTSAFERALSANLENEILRPGFSRFSLHFTMTEKEVEFVMRALDWVATHGWKLLPEYAFERRTAEFYHPNAKKFPGRRWISDLNFSDGKIIYDPQIRKAGAGHDVNNYFEFADALVKKKSERKISLTVMEGYEHLVWFVTPQNCSEWLAKNDAQKFNLPPPAGDEKWKLPNSPFRTFLYAEEEKKKEGQEKKNGGAEEERQKKNGGAEVFVTDVAEEIDSFFGMLEGDDDRSSSSALEMTESVIVEGKKTESVISDQVCELRPEWREAIDLEKEGKKIIFNSNVRWHVPPKKKIWKKTREAIFDFDMLKAGDRVLICVSGGKDSLSLLHTLFFLKSKLGFEFEIGAITVDPMTVTFDPRPLIPYMKQLGINYFYEQQPLIDSAKKANATSICSWCSRMKRGIIYRIAREKKYNVIAMGQHLDDMAESFMMSFFLNGKLRTQKASYVVDDGDLKLIRPFAYVREHDLKSFAYSSQLPVISESCPACFAEPKERARLKLLLDNQESIYPRLYDSMRAAMDPLMRGLPISEADKVRDAELKIIRGIGPAILPKIITAAALMTAGAILGFVLTRKE